MLKNEILLMAILTSGVSAAFNLSHNAQEGGSELANLQFILGQDDVQGVQGEQGVQGDYSSPLNSLLKRGTLKKGKIGAMDLSLKHDDHGEESWSKLKDFIKKAIHDRKSIKDDIKLNKDKIRLVDGEIREGLRTVFGRPYEGIFDISSEDNNKDNKNNKIIDLIGEDHHHHHHYRADRPVEDPLQKAKKSRIGGVKRILGKKGGYQAVIGTTPSDETDPGLFGGVRSPRGAYAGFKIGVTPSVETDPGLFGNTENTDANTLQGQKMLRSNPKIVNMNKNKSKSMSEVTPMILKSITGKNKKKDDSSDQDQEREREKSRGSRKNSNRETGNVGSGGQNNQQNTNSNNVSGGVVRQQEVVDNDGDNGSRTPRYAGRDRQGVIEVHGPINRKPLIPK